MIGNKRKAKYQNEENPKHIKLNKKYILKSFFEKAERLLAAYTDLKVETFIEKIIFKYKLLLLNNIILSLKSHNPILALEKMLSENWHSYKNSILCYTAMPEDEITLFLCDIATFISNYENNKKKSALNLLMPGVCLKSVKEGYPDLNKKDIIITDILKTHIISHCGQYLVPVRILLDMKLKENTDEKFDNPYYNFKLGVESPFIIKEASERLFLHSDSARALREAKLIYHQILQEDQSLYGELIKLGQELYFNGKEGVGSEENAGANAYTAIVNFNNYYSQLDVESINAIPIELKKEITTIISLSSDHKLNFNATEVVDTCISTRRQYLMAAMDGHEEKLMEIKPSLENKKNILVESEKKFKQCHENLSYALENNYTGTDKFFITHALLNNLKVVPQINNAKDIEDLLSLKTEDLMVVLSEHERLAGDVVRKIEDIESLVMFFITTPCDKLHLILPKMIRFLTINNLVENTYSLIMCFIALEPEKLKIVSQCLLEGFKDNRWIANGNQLGRLMDPLSPIQRSIVFNEVKKSIDINDLIFCIKDLDFINYLPSDECTEVLKKIKHHLISLIKDNVDLHTFFMRLSAEIQSVVVNVIKEYIDVNELIKNSFCLGVFLEYLPLEECIECLKAINGTWGNIIKDASDFSSFLSSLSNQRRSFVFNEMIKHIDLQAILDGRYGLFFINNLTLHECEIILDKMKGYINISFRNVDYYNNFFSILDPEKRRIFFDRVNESINIEDIFKNASDLILINYLSLDESEEILNRVGNIISSVKDLEILAGFLSLDRMIWVFDKVKDNIDVIEILDKPFFLGCYLETLSHDECIELFKKISFRWVEFIKNSNDFDSLLLSLSEQKKSLVFHVIKEYIDISLLIESSHDFGIINKLPLAECLSVLKDLEDYWPSIVNRSNDLENIFDEVSSLDRHRFVLNEIINNVRISNFILTLSDLNFLHYLSSEQYDIVFKKIKWDVIFNHIDDVKGVFELGISQDFINKIFFEIRSHVDVIGLCECLDDLSFLDKLSQEDLMIVLQSIQYRWGDFIESGSDFTDLFDSISSEKHSAIFKAAKNYFFIPNLIDCVEDLHFIKYLCWDDFDWVLEKIKGFWSDIVKTGESFTELLDSLSPGKRMLMFQEIKVNKNMTCMFNQFDDLDDFLDSLAFEERVILQEALKISDVPLTQRSQSLLFSFNLDTEELLDEGASYRPQPGI